MNNEKTLNLKNAMKKGPVYFVDWAHKKPNVWFDIKLMKIVDEPEKLENCTICGENFPSYLMNEWLENKGLSIYTIHPNKIANFRKRLGEQKTDENDARLIAMYALREYAMKDESAFRRYEGESELKQLYRTFKQIQKVRNSASNRTWAKNGETGHKDEVTEELRKVESNINKKMYKELKDIPVYDAWLSHVKGCGISISAGLLSEIDIEFFSNVSKVHKWFGLDVSNGKAPRKTKGKTTTFDIKRRALVIGVLGDQFVRNKKSFYRKYYDEDKQRQLNRVYPVDELASKYNGYKKEDTKLTQGHAHNRAVRKAVKLFLSHYWHVSRVLTGLPTRVPYPIEYLGHETMIDPPHMDKVYDYITKNQ